MNKKSYSLRWRYRPNTFLQKLKSRKRFTKNDANWDVSFERKAPKWTLRRFQVTRKEDLLSDADIVVATGLHLHFCRCNN